LLDPSVSLLLLLSLFPLSPNDQARMVTMINLAAGEVKVQWLGYNRCSVFVTVEVVLFVDLVAVVGQVEGVVLLLMSGKVI
jgi:hypothetical protein